MTTMLNETTIRDFGGGWNVSDSDKSLSSRFQPVSENVVRGTDGHFRIRHGYKLFANLKDGVETTGSYTFDITTDSGSGVIVFNRVAHGLVDWDHITITAWGGELEGITDEMVLRTHSVSVVDADNFVITVRGAATGTSTTNRLVTYVIDSHTLGGNSIAGRYYKNYLIIFTDIGEILAVNNVGEAIIIWSAKHAADLTVEPWGYCKRVSAEIIRGRLIAVNGAENDKPLAIEDLDVNYLVDAATLSNSAIPRAEFVIAASQYVLLINTEYGPTMVEIGAKNTVMTCSREASPDDAVEVDVGMLTQTIDSTILGASVIRSRVFLGFTDRTMLGTLGIYNDAIHEPDFNDNIAEFGTFSHASIVSLGNDIFCAGMNGINSLETSRATGEFEPATISDLIHPVLLRHLARLTEDDRRYKTFAVFDNNNRAYMFFAPKYSAGSTTLSNDPLIVTTTLQPNNLMYIRYPEHVLDEGDYIDISGATSYGDDIIPEESVNGRRRIRHVVDASTLVVEIDPYPPSLNGTFGGDAVVIEPVNDETVGYVYEYNPRLKIRRWTRFRDMDFAWGARSQLNKLFFGKEGKIWQMGDNNVPFSADKIGDFDERTYTQNYAYSVGTRVRDDTDGLVYECMVAHTSSASYTFEEARTNLDTHWDEWRGQPITWAMDTAWSDFDKRSLNKEIETVRFDTKGTAAFTFSIFTNSNYKDFDSLELSPIRETEFVGQDSPGFGGGDQPYGGGRNTAQEWLHSMPCTAKLFRLRFSGSTIHPLQVNAVSLYYKQSKALT